MTTDTDYAWAAGIIDGEGSFWIAGASSISLQVKMSHEGTIKRIQKIIGGTIYEYNADMPSFKSPAGWNKSTQWGCRVNGRALLEVIESVGPYLVTKKKHSQVVKRFCNTIGDKGRLSPAAHRVREACRADLKALNKRQ